VRIEDRLGYQIADTEHAVRKALDARLRTHEVTIAQWSVLNLLRMSPGMATTELAARSYVSQPAVTEIVGKLERAGLLRRSRREGDGRVRELFATEEGVRVASQGDEQVMAVETQLRAGLSQNEQAQLSELLARCRESLRARPA